MSENKAKQVPLKTVLRTRRYLVYSIVSVVVSLLLLVVFLIPRVGVLISAQQILETKQQEQIKLAEKVELLDGFNTSIFQRENARVNQILPSGKPFFQLLFGLQSLTSEQGVSLSGLEISPGVLSTESGTVQEAGVVADRSGVQSVNFDVILLGESQKIRETIDRFAILAPVLDVESFTLNPKGEGQSAPLFEAKVKVRALYAPIRVSVGRGTLPRRLTPEEDRFLTELDAFRLPPQNDSELGEVAPATPSGKTNPFAN